MFYLETNSADNFRRKTLSETDVAPQAISGRDGMDWKSPGGANNPTWKDWIGEMFQSRDSSRINLDPNAEAGGSKLNCRSTLHPHFDQRRKNQGSKVAWLPGKLL